MIWRSGIDEVIARSGGRWSWSLWSCLCVCVFFERRAGGVNVLHRDREVAWRIGRREVVRVWWRGGLDLRPSGRRE